MNLSVVNGYKVVIETLKLVKKSVDSSQKNNTAFINLCDIAINSMTSYIADGNISPEERVEARKMINKIIDSAEIARKDSSSTTKWIIGGVSFDIVMGLLAYFISKIGKR